MIYSENNINLSITQDFLGPKRMNVYINPKMSLNRELVFQVLKMFVDSSDSPISCLDAFAATGVSAIQWKKNLPLKTNVTASDLKEASLEQIKINCKLNNVEFSLKNLFEIVDDKPGDASESISLIKINANALMHLKSFDFIFLDPFGSTTPYMDAAFKNIRNNGILILTSTDIASLLTRNPKTVLRNYCAKVVKTEYVKELTVRTILAEAARSAAKCNKGFKVLLSVFEKNFIFLSLKILRGSMHANELLLNVKDLLHCRICEERAWYPSDKLSPIVDPYSSLLSCDCSIKNTGITGVKIGPFWSGDIYDFDFVQRIINEDNFVKHSKKFQAILKVIDEEVTEFQSASSTNTYPSFYYFTKNMKFDHSWPKFEKILATVRSRGFRASRTHFDLSAIKTDATLSVLREIICQMRE